MDQESVEAQAHIYHISNALPGQNLSRPKLQIFSYILLLVIKVVSYKKGREDEMCLVLLLPAASTFMEKQRATTRLEDTLGKIMTA